MTNYANSEGGTSHLTDPANYPFDQAQIEIAGTIEKDIISTSETDSSDVEVGIVGDERPVMIGEVVTYRVYTRVPEGTTNNLQFRDNTPAGLQYVANSARYVFLSDTGTALNSTTLGNTGFAMANPDLAPYGAAAREVLEQRGLWDALRDRIVQGQDIGQTYSFVYSGNAELGFVAYSQIARPRQPIEGSFWLVPEELHEPIEQQAVLLKDVPGARAFLAFVESPDAHAIIRSFGYGP